jgi:hypothetical protein
VGTRGRMQAHGVSWLTRHLHGGACRRTWVHGGAWGLPARMAPAWRLPLRTAPAYRHMGTHWGPRGLMGMAAPNARGACMGPHGDCVGARVHGDGGPCRARCFHEARGGAWSCTRAHGDAWWCMGAHGLHCACMGTHRGACERTWAHAGAWRPPCSHCACIGAHGGALDRMGGHVSNGVCIFCVGIGELTAHTTTELGREWAHVGA